MHVNVLARLFRGKMLAMLGEAQDAGRLKFFNGHAGLADRRAFKQFLGPLRHTRWVVYVKAPFGGPEAVHTCQWALNFPRIWAFNFP